MQEQVAGFRLRFLSFFGPQKQTATVKFGPGLNVLYGASDTGKSFVVDTIDFMLGGKGPLEEISERIGYDRIFLGIETLDGKTFTISRSTEGSGFILYEGLLEQLPSADVTGRVLADTHNEKSDDNLSSFLLACCDLKGKRIRKNARNETNSLSFRNIARLLIVTETEIVQRRSPLLDGNYTADTANTSTFKLLLTGVDDSALVSSVPRGPEELSRDAQLQLLDQLLGEYRDRLRELAKQPDELQEQLEKIDISIGQHAAQLSATEAEFQTAAARRRELRKRLEEGRDRSNEISGMLERFGLLDRHYQSDIERLRAIEEGGTLFAVLGKVSCPLCGAEPNHQRGNVTCEGNIDAVVEASRMEIAKIEVLRADLATTVSDLRREGKSFDRRLPQAEQELAVLSEVVDGNISPKLAKLRKSYADFADRRGAVREALSMYATVQDLERRRADLEGVSDADKKSGTVGGDIQTAVADLFSRTIEAILTAWHFPDDGRVHFDSKTRDIVINGKPRGARGKGLRAITHAAFTLGLLAFCRANKTPHPGFVVLDSPLLAYREPEGEEDDLTGTDLKEQFYRYLQELPRDRQVIVVENVDPPDFIKEREQVEMFGKNHHSGRYGLFPFIDPKKAAEDTSLLKSEGEGAPPPDGAPAA